MVGKKKTPTVARPRPSPRAVEMAAPLHPLPKHPKKWIPNFNPNDGLLAEENLHNFMLAINLNGVVEEECVVRLFPYTLEESAGSWYFSLPLASITSWDIFEE